MRKMINDYIKDIENSWTWKRLTKAEQDQFYFGMLAYKSSCKITKEALSLAYYGFLCALGYQDGNFSWREDNKR